MIDINRQRLHEIISYITLKPSRGENKAGRRSPRIRGRAGEWRNHFSGRVPPVFKERFGHTLIKIGYETDLNWRYELRKNERR